MKKVIGFLLGACICIIIIVQAFANRPALTTVLTEKTAKALYYTSTFETGLPTALVIDSVYIYDPDGNPFNIEKAGYEDSLITVQLGTDETTADSIGYRIIFEVSPLVSPTASQYSTALIDTLSDLIQPGISKFHIRSIAGLNRSLRILVVESDTTEDSQQTVTVRTTIPRQ
jgi:hypothetical protein